MPNTSEFSASSSWAFDHPQYLPLEGEPALQALEWLVRKGGMLRPAVSRTEAAGIIRYMNLEHFKPGSVISFNAQSDETGRLMLILAGDANIRMRQIDGKLTTQDYSPLGQAQAKWFSVSAGATLGLVHAFSGLSSKFVAQAETDLFVASLSRIALYQMKRQEPVLALRFLEITAQELALVTLDHEKNLVAVSNVARSMQEHIGQESGETAPAPLFGLPSF
jgi:CRP-like cAMP-binding protein